MSPSSDPIAEIKSRLDVVDVVGQKVTLKKTGQTFKGLCPFHGEKTPSFIVFPDKGNYHCFGCGANGDIFSFVMKTENLDFAEALRTLAARAGVELKPRLTEDAAQRRRSQVAELLDHAALFYQQALRRPDAQAARDYLAGRGISSGTIDQFRLGWAPDSWDALYLSLSERGTKPETMMAAGLVAERDSGGYYDRFRARVIFPISNERGELVGFGGRTLGDGQPKYLNSPQTELFDKSATLYGIDQARTGIRAMNRVTVVEGYVDVLIAHQSGIKEVVASLGTALTERQVGILKRLTRTVVLALDADAAGDEAVLRGLEVARQVYADARVAVPLPQGLVRLESRLGADILIAALPRGRDPDEIIREDPEQWRTIVDDARSVVDFYFAVILGRTDLTSPKDTTVAVRKLLPIIGEVRDPVQRSLYLQRLSDRVHIAEQLLASELARLRLTARAPAAGDVGESPAPARRRSTLDEYALGLLLLYPAQAAPFAAELREDDWELVESQQAFLSIRQQIAAGGSPDRATLVGALAEPVAAWLRAVLQQEEARPSLDERAATAEQERCVRDIRRRSRRARLQTFAAHLRDLEASGDADGIAELHRQAERELAQLETDERLSKLAWSWRRTTED
ncbi:MAG TPA: DNA primase [Chloroflexota bacterium]|nr:DNA primase [Chloroflexota bacterium]